MESKNKKNTEKHGKQNVISEQKPKSRFTLFREKYPMGGEIYDMKAVLR